MRRGVLGGTFDPIHHGHLDVAEAAARALGLDEVLIVPSLVPPHREPPRASAPHRFAMAALAIQDRPAFRVSDLELLAPGPSYTADTIERLAASGADLDTMFFVTGADAFRDIATWKDYPRLLDRCHFVAVSRPGSPAGDLRARLPSLAARMRHPPVQTTREPGIFLVEAPTAAVSSTDVRHRLRRGLEVTDLVPAAVAAHIARHGLYRETLTGSA
jgi:nicotinate-nucleotide adenylyltransferase